MTVVFCIPAKNVERKKQQTKKIGHIKKKCWKNIVKSTQ